MGGLSDRRIAMRGMMVGVIVAVVAAVGCQQTPVERVGVNRAETGPGEKEGYIAVQETIALGADGVVQVAGKKMSDQELEAHLKRLPAGRHRSLTILASGEAPYSRLVAVTAVCRGAGFDQVGLGKLEDGKGPSPGTVSEGIGDMAPPVTMRGKPVTLEGRPPEVGEKAPGFVAVANDMSAWTFEPGAGKAVVLSAVPSLDTGVCSMETKRFEKELEKTPGVDVVTVSMDLPFAQKRWCGAEGVKNVKTVSDFKDRSFAQAYGVRIKENGLLSRAVWVVGKDGRIVYREIVKEVSKEPDYDKVMAAAKEAAGK
jgi:thiol peroxidase